MPIEYVSNAEINSTPPYPDAGTQYLGFSKTQKGSSYKLSKQDPICCNANSDNNFTLYDPQEGKTFYMTDLILQAPGASTNVIYLTDGLLAAAAGVLMTFYQLANWNVQLHFDVPIKFTQFVRLSLLAGGGNRLYASAVGWIEDN